MRLADLVGASCSYCGEPFEPDADVWGWDNGPSGMTHAGMGSEQCLTAARAHGPEVWRRVVIRLVGERIRTCLEDTDLSLAFEELVRVTEPDPTWMPAPTDGPPEPVPYEAVFRGQRVRFSNVMDTGRGLIVTIGDGPFAQLQAWSYERFQEWLDDEPYYAALLDRAIQQWVGEPPTP